MRRRYGHDCVDDRGNLNTLITVLIHYFQASCLYIRSHLAMATDAIVTVIQTHVWPTQWADKLIGWPVPYPSIYDCVEFYLGRSQKDGLFLRGMSTCAA